VRRRGDIGRIRDEGTYFSPFGKQGREALYLGGITEVAQMAWEKSVGSDQPVFDGRTGG
jgi:hypothetical protein